MEPTTSGRHQDDYDILMKVVLIGDSGVGKTNLLSRFCRGEFNAHSKATIGVEFATVNIVVEHDIVKAQIWDTAGQERYRAITSSFYRGAVGAMLVYDVTAQESFEHVERWLAELREHADSKIVIMLVGNKIDLESQRVVPTSAGLGLAEKEALLLIETSAKNNLHVSDAFQQLVHNIHGIIARHRVAAEEEEERTELPESSTIELGPQPEATPPKKKSSCC